jgi:hypothetical protein
LRQRRPLACQRGHGRMAVVPTVDIVGQHGVIDVATEKAPPE